MTDSYTVELASSAARDLKRLDRVAQARILRALGLLRNNPRPPAARAVVGHAGYLRVRVGHYRIVYTVQDDRLLVLVLAAGHRREVYRRLT